MKYLVNRETKEHRIQTDSVADCQLVGMMPDVWRTVIADSEGWIKHDGGECPLPDGHKVNVRYHGMETAQNESLADSYDWSYVKTRPFNIDKYRPILDDKAEAKYPEWDASLTYRDGDKVTLNGRVVTIGDVVADNLIAVDDTPYPVGDPRGWQEVGDGDLIGRLRASHKAASELPDIIAELREVLGEEIMEMLCQQQPPTNVYGIWPADNRADPEPDMTDWRNWREGDLVECISWKGTTCKAGNIYAVLPDGYVAGDGGVKVIIKRGLAMNFRFHSRPTKEQDNANNS